MRSSYEVSKTATPVPSSFVSCRGRSCLCRSLHLDSVSLGEYRTREKQAGSVYWVSVRNSSSSAYRDLALIPIRRPRADHEGLALTGAPKGQSPRISRRRLDRRMRWPPVQRCRSAARKRPGERELVEELNATFCFSVPRGSSTVDGRKWLSPGVG